MDPAFQIEYTFNNTKPGAGMQRIVIGPDRAEISNQLTSQSTPTVKSAILSPDQVKHLVKRLESTGFMRLDAVYPNESHSAHFPAHAIRFRQDAQHEKIVSTQNTERPVAFEAARQVIREAVQQAIPDLDINTFTPGL